MGKRNFSMYTNGTSALKMPRWVEAPNDAKIIAFPTSRQVASSSLAPAVTGKAPAPKRASGFVRKVLDSSEMYCSLRYESMKGCPYNVFSERAIAALSLGGALIGIVSLLLGA